MFYCILLLCFLYADGGHLKFANKNPEKSEKDGDGEPQVKSKDVECPEIDAEGIAFRYTQSEKLNYFEPQCLPFSLLTVPHPAGVVTCFKLFLIFFVIYFIGWQGVV